MTMTTRSRPCILRSATVELSTELGCLSVTVSMGEDGEPFEVFGRMGKSGSFEYGVTELACRLISLHLRRGAPLEEVIEECAGIADMRPWPNRLAGGRAVRVLGLGDGIAHALEVVRGMQSEEAEEGSAAA